MKPQYGFDPMVFKMLKKKGEAMKPEDRRGVLVLDEMSISEGVNFDTEKLSVMGFTDLGDYTPDHQKTERADHALILIFQPFRGKWVQNIAAFLSKGAANGEVLSHLVTECICLLENVGFNVDVVTADGGQWNRGMWKRFGLKDLDASCVHPCSNDNEITTTNSRRLWFCSDFSHLIKNFRNFIMSKEAIMVVSYHYFYCRMHV
ncbi:uncharacterized protein LOC122505674 [Leptopilina heterotoma]|uniref:uncharacterized protein LOC122505674 n=1 Tax=Leptopilina heterotoma TaxID=63436 RepID=UPI001CA7FF69|nr:uncharacterized protein LOC122505674 [Leptopilina heterotoma]XP_043473388.1 uncharacterized protein LOC122505674 [Leptopilina heterotoma]